MPRSGWPSRATTTPIAWIPRDRRYGEKLATPDITIADLIGEVDPIKVAEGRYLSDELTIHYGLLPRTNRGIFALNELPDLAERIQVGLLNIMEERDVQIRGYKVRLPLDLYVVASANPEDYTNRGRIITPLKDRFGSQIRTHYPAAARGRDRDHGGRAHRFADDGPRDHEPRVHEADRGRAHPPGAALARDQPALRRLGAGQRSATTRTCSRARSSGPSGWARRWPPRGSATSAPSSPPPAARSSWRRLGDASEDKVLASCMQRAVLNVFNRTSPPASSTRWWARSRTASRSRSRTRCRRASTCASSARCAPLQAAVRKLGASDPASVAAAVEFVLEGLHLSKKLNKDVQAGQSRYRG